MVYDEKPLRGKSQESIMAASIFIGCRKANVARSFKEIWALTNVPRKEIGKVFKIMDKIIRERMQPTLMLHITVKTAFKPPKLRPRI